MQPLDNNSGWEVTDQFQKRIKVKMSQIMWWGYDSMTIDYPCFWISIRKDLFVPVNLTKLVNSFKTPTK